MHMYMYVQLGVYMYVHVQSFRGVLANSPLQEELSLEGYRRHQASQKAAPPLSDAEQALQDIRDNEVQSLLNCTARK